MSTYLEISPNDDLLIQNEQIHIYQTQCFLQSSVSLKHCGAFQFNKKKKKKKERKKKKKGNAPEAAGKQNLVTLFLLRTV